LGELFEQLGGKAYFDIELKSRSTLDTGLTSKVAEEIRANRLERRCVVSSFNPFALRHFRHAEPNVPIGIIWSHSDELYWFLRHGEGALIANVDFLKPEASLAHALPWYLRIGGKPVIPWTVNDGVAARSLLDGGAAGVISDIADEVMPAMMAAR
jgi:Glycerophosphoryl diester phosphodiesterase